MQLINRYLQEVRPYLPEQTCDDILAELQISLEEQVLELMQDETRIDDSELFIKNQKNVLQKMGHPIKVAGAYQTQQYLIGPTLFPAFRRTLYVVFILAVLVQFLIAFAVGLNSSWDLTLSGVFFEVLGTAVYVVFIVTAAFALLEYYGEQLHWFETWKPDYLMRSPLCAIDRSAVMTNAITEGVFLLWWNDILVLQNWIPYLGEQYPFVLSSAWDVLFWPANIVTGTYFVLHTFVLIRGLWSHKTLILEFMLGGLFTAMIVSLLLNHVIVETGNQMDSTTLRSVQWTSKSVLVVILALTLWDMYIAARNFLRYSRDADQVDQTVQAT